MPFRYNPKTKQMEAYVPGANPGDSGAIPNVFTPYIPPKVEAAPPLPQPSIFGRLKNSYHALNDSLTGGFNTWNNAMDKAGEVNLGFWKNLGTGAARGIDTTANLLTGSEPNLGAAYNSAKTLIPTPQMDNPYQTIGQNAAFGFTNPTTYKNMAVGAAQAIPRFMGATAASLSGQEAPIVNTRLAHNILGTEPIKPWQSSNFEQFVQNQGVPKPLAQGIGVVGGLAQGVTDVLGLSALLKGGVEQAGSQILKRGQPTLDELVTRGVGNDMSRLAQEPGGQALLPMGKIPTPPPPAPIPLYGSTEIQRIAQNNPDLADILNRVQGVGSNQSPPISFAADSTGTVLPTTPGLYAAPEGNGFRIPQNVEALSKFVTDAKNNYRTLGTADIMGTNQPENAGLRMLEDFHTTPQGQQMSAEELANQIQAGKVLPNPDGTITVYRGGNMHEGNQLVSVSTDPQTAAEFGNVQSFQVKPEDVAVSKGLDPNELLVNRTSLAPIGSDYHPTVSPETSTVPTTPAETGTQIPYEPYTQVNQGLGNGFWGKILDKVEQNPLARVFQGEISKIKHTPVGQQIGDLAQTVKNSRQAFLNTVTLPLRTAQGLADKTRLPRTFEAWNADPEINALQNKVASFVDSKAQELYPNYKSLGEGYRPDHFLDPSKKKEMLSAIMEHEKVSEEEAINKLGGWLKPEGSDPNQLVDLGRVFAQRSKAGSFEFQRNGVPDYLQQFYIKDPVKAWNHYLTYVADISRAEVFGANNERIKPLISMLPQDLQKHGVNILKNLSLRMPSSPSDRIIGQIKEAEMASKLGGLYSAVQNLSQQSSIPSSTSIPEWLQSLTETLTSPRGTTRKMIGQGIEDITLNQRINPLRKALPGEDISLADRLGNLLDVYNKGGFKAGGFPTTETINRFTQAGASERSAQNLFDKMMQAPEGSQSRSQLARLLNNLTINPQEAAARGSLTPEELVRAANRGVQKVQFRDSSLDVPQWLVPQPSDSPFERGVKSLAGQFKSYSLQQPKVTLGNINELLRFGRPAPLINQAATAVPIGYGIAKTENWIRGKSDQPITPMQVLETGYGGPLGALASLYQAGKYSNVGGYVTGPTISDMGDLITALAQAYGQGSIKPVTSVLGKRFTPGLINEYLRRQKNLSQ